MSEELKPCPFCGSESVIDADYGQEYWCECRSCKCRTGKFRSRHLADQHWNTRSELAALKATQGDSVAWRDHSVNHAKGEKCPATIETLQAAWDRDQELLLDQKNVISKLKETINQLRQKRTTRPTATIQGEANRRPQTCNGRSCSWCKEGADPCHYTAAPASADAVSVPAAMPERWEDRLSRMHQTIQAGCWPKRWVDDAKDYELGELRALLARQEVKS